MEGSRSLKADIIKEIEDRTIKGLIIWDDCFNARVAVQVINSVSGTVPAAVRFSTIPAHAATAL